MGDRSEVRNQKQSVELEYALTKQEKYKELIKELSSLDGHVTPENGHRLYIKCVSRTVEFNGYEQESVAKLTKEKLGVKTSLFYQDLGKLEKEISKDEEGSQDKGLKGKNKKGSEPEKRRAQCLVGNRLCYRTNDGWVVGGQPDDSADENKRDNPLYHFSTEGHLRLLKITQGKETAPRISEVYDKLESILTLHIAWKNPYHPTIITLWVISTYFASIFQWLGYLWITSPARRCGKSLLLDILSYVAFNATSPLVNPRPAYLYRTVDVDFPTVIIDELSKFKGDGGDDYSEVLGLLNAGAKNGGAVARMEKVGDSFEARYYQAYCPKALAGLTSLPDTLEDRCLRINMSRKKKIDKVARFNFRKKKEELSELRDNLYIVGQKYDNEVMQFYDNIEEIDIPDKIDDRSKDILEPLFSIASIIDTEKGNMNVTTILKSYALELAGIKGSDDHADLAQHTVKALKELNFEEGECKIVTGKQALELFSQEPELGWCDTQKKAGNLLNKLGFYSKTHRVFGQLRRGYKISRQDLEDLKERYANDTENNV